jgi:hypothetical protein
VFAIGDQERQADRPAALGPEEEADLGSTREVPEARPARLVIASATGTHGYNAVGVPRHRRHRQDRIRIAVCAVDGR